MGDSVDVRCLDQLAAIGRNRLLAMIVRHDEENVGRSPDGLLLSRTAGQDQERSDKEDTESTLTKGPLFRRWRTIDLRIAGSARQRKDRQGFRFSISDFRFPIFDCRFSIWVRDRRIGGLEDDCGAAALEVRKRRFRFLRADPGITSHPHSYRGARTHAFLNDYRGRAGLGDHVGPKSKASSRTKAAPPQSPRFHIGRSPLVPLLDSGF